jgi:hypothetical protein
MESQCFSKSSSFNANINIFITVVNTKVSKIKLLILIPVVPNTLQMHSCILIYFVILFCIHYKTAFPVPFISGLIMAMPLAFQSRGPGSILGLFKWDVWLTELQ